MKRPLGTETAYGLVFGRLRWCNEGLSGNYSHNEELLSSTSRNVYGHSRYVFRTMYASFVSCVNNFDAVQMTVRVLRRQHGVN